MKGHRGKQGWQIRGEVSVIDTSMELMNDCFGEDPDGQIHEYC